MDMNNKTEVKADGVTSFNGIWNTERLKKEPLLAKFKSAGYDLFLVQIPFPEGKCQLAFDGGAESLISVLNDQRNYRPDNEERWYLKFGWMDNEGMMLQLALNILELSHLCCSDSEEVKRYMSFLVNKYSNS